MLVFNMRRFIIVCLYSLTITKTASSQNDVRPHIILIVADDVGWNDVGFHGSNQIPTPNIDALAYNGVILNRFYTSPSCTPSRAALLTGQYPIRFGLQGIPITAGENLHLPTHVPTLPERLQDLGYKTHLVGKWHLGAAFKNVTPTSRGFDSHFGYWNGYVGYFNHEAIGGNMTGLDMHFNHDPVWNKQNHYVTDLLTKKAELIIWEHNVNEPLFLMMSHLAGHTGRNGKDLEVPDVKENDRLFGYIADKDRRLYAGMIHEMDKSVGHIIEVLAEREILNNSLVIFISDNGAQTIGDHRNWGSNWPLRGLKMTVHEGGVRNIAVAYSSLLQNIKQVNNDLFHIADLMPTIYAAAGGDVEDLGPLDGINQWQLLTHNKESKRSELLLHIDEVRKCSGYISDNGRYKLINGSTIAKYYDLYYGEDGRDHSSPAYDIQAIIGSRTYVAIGKDIPADRILQLRNEVTLGDCRKPISSNDICTYLNWCLYDLFEDPCEATNIASTHPQVVDRLSKKLEAAWTYLKPQKPKFVDPKANPIYYNNTWYTWLDD